LEIVNSCFGVRRNLYVDRRASCPICTSLQITLQSTADAWVACNAFFWFETAVVPPVVGSEKNSDGTSFKRALL
jgi:hypothetical protein